MRNGDTDRFRIRFVKKAQLETLYVLFYRCSISESVAIPHPPLRGTFPPGEGISPSNSNFPHHRTIPSGSGWERLQTTLVTTCQRRLAAKFQFVHRAKRITMIENYFPVSSGFSVISPARLLSNRSLTCSGFIFWPRAHMSFVMAASMVMSRPWMTPRSRSWFPT